MCDSGAIAELYRVVERHDVDDQAEQGTAINEPQIFADIHVLISLVPQCITNRLGGLSHQLLQRCPPAYHEADRQDIRCHAGDLTLPRPRPAKDRDTKYDVVRSRRAMKI